MRFLGFIDRHFRRVVCAHLYMLFKNPRNFFWWMTITVVEQGVRVKGQTTISTIAVLCTFLISPALLAQTKIDPFFDALAHIQHGTPAKVQLMQLDGNRPKGENLEAFIKTRDLPATIDLIDHIGGSLRTIITNDLVTATIPQASFEKLQKADDVIFVEAAKPIEVRNDVAMTELNGYEVHEGTNLPAAYTGNGVIIGIVDTGIDLTHDDFLDENGASRIVFAWDQQGTGEAGPSEIFNTYGTECDTTTISNGTCPMGDNEGHGTHIAGTAAGRDELYGGVAPDANIIAVRYRSELIIDGYATPVFSTTICEAAYYVFKKAEELDMPAVVNLSLGSHIGAHDGMSLFEQCLDALVEDSSGRAIVAAAGNEHVSHSLFTGLHAGYDVSGSMGTNFRIRSLDQGRIFYLDVWASTESEMSFGIAVRNTSSLAELGTSGMVAMGTLDSGTIDNGKISWQINATETKSPLNGRPHVGITIVLGDSVSNPDQYDFDFLVSGAGHFDAWWYPDKTSSSVVFTNKSGDSGRSFTYVPGDDRMNVAIPATAHNVVAVGGYASRTEWDRGSGCCQVAFTLGELLPFSSLGPSGDHDYTGQKPEITAPGAMIASAKSIKVTGNVLLDLPDGAHMLAAGTSMATPFVSGTIALMFSADPTYTFEDARRYIIESAYRDDYTGAVPNDAWGYGKLDILAAVQTAVLGGPTGSSSSPSLSLPSSGGASSCSMIPEQEMGLHVVPALLSVLSMAAVIWTARRKRKDKK